MFVAEQDCYCLTWSGTPKFSMRRGSHEPRYEKTDVLSFRSDEARKAFSATVVT